MFFRRPDIRGFPGELDPNPDQALRWKSWTKMGCYHSWQAQQPAWIRSRCQQSGEETELGYMLFSLTESSRPMLVSTLILEEPLAIRSSYFLAADVQMEGEPSLTPNCSHLQTDKLPCAFNLRLGKTSLA